MPKILLNIPDTAKAQEFLAHFVPNLDFIKEFEIVEEGTDTEEQYDKNNYTVADIKAIAAQFPDDYAWTYSDLENYFPQDSSIKVEIIDNQLFIIPTPSSTHQMISDELVFQFNLFVRKHKLGQFLSAPMDIKLDENNVVQPDILFIAVSKYPVIKKNYISGAPDIAVEIWSPGNSRQERERKRDVYERHAVTEYWQITPNKKAVRVETLRDVGEYEVFTEADQSGIVKSSVLPGFEVDISTLFENLPAAI